MGKRHRGVAVMKRRRDRVEERANSEGRNVDRGGEKYGKTNTVCEGTMWKKKGKLVQERQ